MVESLKLKNPNVFDLLDELENTGIEPSVFTLITKAIRDNDVDTAIKLLNKLS